MACGSSWPPACWPVRRTGSRKPRWPFGDIKAPYNKDMNQVTIWAPPRPGSWQRENGLCQATCNLFWPQQAEPKEVGIPACAQQVDPLRLGGVGSSTPGRNNQALPPAVPSAGHAAGRLALTVPCSLGCAAHGYFNAGSVAGRVVALLPAVRASAQNRLRRQHPQGPVDRLAGDRLAVAEEQADLPDRASGRAEIPGGLHLPGRQPVLAPAVPAAEQISAKRICAAPI